jgi:hypothetical protein
MPVIQTKWESGPRLRRWPVVLIACAAAGCGGVDASTFCSDQEACRGGNAADIKACGDEVQIAQKTAGDLGCSNEYKAYFNCVAANATCHQVNVGPCMAGSKCATPGATCKAGQCSIGNYGVDTMGVGGTSPCAAENAAYDNCSGMGQLVGGGP